MAVQTHDRVIIVRIEAMAEEEEVEKYKRLYEEQKAKVKELERQNLQLKVRVFRDSPCRFSRLGCSAVK